VDLDKVQEIVRAIVNLYELWKDWKEKDEIQMLLSKIPKPKPPPQPIVHDTAKISVFHIFRELFWLGEI